MTEQGWANILLSLILIATVYCALMLSLIFNAIDDINAKLTDIGKLLERRGSQ